MTGPEPIFLVMAAMAAIGVVVAILLWPATEPGKVPHDPPDLPLDHPHLRERGHQDHRHPIVIDDLHRRWPGPGIQRTAGDKT